MSSIKGIQQRLENLFAGVADAIPTTGPLDRTATPRTVSRPRGWVWELDLEGVYSWASPEIERILGFTSDEVLGQRFESVGFEEDVAKLVRTQLETGEQIQQLLVQATHKHGRSFKILIRAMHRIDAAGAPLGYRGVSQLVELETTIPERLVVEVPTPADEIGATTPPKYAPGWGAILGFEDVEGDIHRLEDGKETLETRREQGENRLVIPLQVQDEIIGEIELESKMDGSSWQEEDQALANAIAHELAITLQDARSYQLTQQALEEMREADRLKSQFLANMSHELRTPLNSIIGFSRVILKGIDGPVTETQEQDLSAIYNAGQHLLGLINNILDISKIEAGKMELAFTDVDLSEIIRGVMATAVGLVKDKPIELITDIPEQLPFVQADNIRIRQVLLNLVSNAAKFTEEGHIGVSARTIRRGNQNELVIAVFDTGPGIDQQDQERIFEPFSQVDASPTRKTGGTGLGLSISRHLVELHGGVIWVESIPDEGSTFAFTLPYDPDLQFTRSSAPLVLGVDFDPASLLHYRQSLEASGYRFHALSRPDQTIEVTKALQPQAILLDLMSTEEQPWYLLNAIAEDPSLQAIPTLLSDYDDHKDEGILFPVIFWLTRSLTPEEFCARIEMLASEPSVKPKVIFLDEGTPLWSDLINGVEAQSCLDLIRVTELKDFKTVMEDSHAKLIVLELSGSTSMGAEAINTYGHLALSLDNTLIGLLPDDLSSTTVQELASLIETWKHSQTIPRGPHLESILNQLQVRLPIRS